MPKSSTGVSFYPAFQLSIPPAPGGDSTYLSIVPTFGDSLGGNPTDLDPTQVQWVEDRLSEFVDSLAARSDVVGGALRLYRIEETKDWITL